MADSTTSAFDMLAEIDRELAQRARVYRRLVEQGKLTREKADRQIALMRAIRVEISAIAEDRAAQGRLI